MLGFLKDSDPWKEWKWKVLLEKRVARFLWGFILLLELVPLFVEGFLGGTDKENDFGGSPCYGVRGGSTLLGWVAVSRRVSRRVSGLQGGFEEPCKCASCCWKHHPSLFCDFNGKPERKPLISVWWGSSKETARPFLARSSLMFEGEVDAWLATSFAQNGRQGSKELPHGSPTSPERTTSPVFIGTNVNLGSFRALRFRKAVLGRK